MKSAFGVEHGEIAKSATTLAGKTYGRLHRMGEGQVSVKGIGRAAGKNVKSLGNTMQRFPGTTGGIAVGSTTGGAYKYLSNKKPPKKKKR